MRLGRVLAPSAALLCLTAALGAVAAQSGATPAPAAGVTVVAGGLTNPRGFAWDADGALLLALAGNGGATRFPVAEGFTLEIGLSSSVVRIADGCVAPVALGLVSAKWSEPDWVWGAMDVAVLNGERYVLASGAGPTWMSPSTRSGVFRANADGTMTMVADLTTWIAANPPQVVTADYNSDGSLFDLEAAGDALLLSEAVGSQIIRVTPSGEISLLADLSAQHPVPTGIAVDADGNAFVGFESAVPYVDGSVTVVKVAPDGSVSDAWTGLTRVADVALGPDGALYAAELSTGNTLEEPYVHAGTGRIVRQTGPDRLEVVAEGLDFPTGLGFGPDGALYVSGPANGSDDGDGWLARVGDGAMPANGAALPACPPPAPATPAA